MVEPAMIYDYLVGAVVAYGSKPRARPVWVPAGQPWRWSRASIRANWSPNCDALPLAKSNSDQSVEAISASTTLLGISYAPFVDVQTFRHRLYLRRTADPRLGDSMRNCRRGTERPAQCARGRRRRAPSLVPETGTNQPRHTLSHAYPTQEMTQVTQLGPDKCADCSPFASFKSPRFVRV